MSMIRSMKSASMTLSAAPFKWTKAGLKDRLRGLTRASILSYNSRITSPVIGMREKRIWNSARHQTRVARTLPEPSRPGTVTPG
jgi:hypothetical protein